MKKRFRLTFEVVTEESSREGDADRRGFVSAAPGPWISPAESDWLPEVPDVFCLRDAVEFLLARDSQGPVEADSCPVSRKSPPRWFTYGGSMDMRGESVSVSMHVPESVSGSSAMRIARVLNCYGCR
jgi:hypothetical protein